MSPKQICECRFCGDRFTPQGHYSHEQYCDENPNYGIPYDRQEALGLEPGASSDDVDGSRRDEPEGLPPTETIGPNKKARDEPPSCPLCGGEAMDASEARRAYQEAADRPHPKALKAYQLADHTCSNPNCAALWGEKYPEPVPMVAVMES